MRAFVTGGRGFVGRWLAAHLADMGDEVVGADAVASDDVAEVDVTDGPALAEAMRRARPDAVYHLAALAHVGDSWDEPEETFRVNAGGTLSVLQAARHCRPEGDPPRVLLVCSAEVYGVVTPDDLPLTEDSPLRPVTPYAASKVAAEYLGLQAHLGYGIPVIRVRAFNHAGPGQSRRFVLASLAEQVAAAERSGDHVVKAGNLDARRDFTDVRDVVRAYRLLVERGEPGEIYQVCSGEALAVGELARRMLAMSTAALRLESRPARLRALDIPVLCGDPSRLRDATGWKPAYGLDDTLADTLEWWRRQGD